MLGPNHAVLSPSRPEGEKAEHVRSGFGSERLLDKLCANFIIFVVNTAQVNAHVPTFSISIEWENVRFSELNRTRKVLRQLRRELSGLAPLPEPPEVVFLYDRQAVDGDLVAQVVNEELLPQTIPVRTRFIATDRLRYYELKNFSAASIESEILVFLDCDVIPEQGWLAALLEPFADPAVQVVGGESYIDCEGLYSKALALFWFAELRNEASGLVPAGFFYANNVAFRRQFFLTHPFPEVPAFRKQCTLLSEALRADGVELLRQQRARVSHPCPRGLRNFAASALHNGRDQAIYADLRYGHNRRRWRMACGNYRNRLNYSFKRIADHHNEVSLGKAGAMGAFAIAFAYCSLRALGEAVSIVRPNLIQRLLPA